MEGIETLANLDGEEAVQLLIGALNDSELLVKKSAANALGQIGNISAAEPLIKTLDDYQMRDDSIKALLRLNIEQVVEKLILALQNRSNWKTIRCQAVKILVQLGNKKAVEPLIDVLNDTDIKTEAIEALVKLGDKRAVELLIQALTDENYNVRETAAQALGQFGDVRAIDPLIGVLKERSFSFELMVGPSWQAQEQAAKKKMSAVKALQPGP